MTATEAFSPSLGSLSMMQPLYGHLTLEHLQQQISSLNIFPYLLLSPDTVVSIMNLRRKYFDTSPQAKCIHFMLDLFHSVTINGNMFLIFSQASSFLLRNWFAEGISVKTKLTGKYQKYNPNKSKRHLFI